MKLSISLPDDDVAFVDEYVAQNNASSRSAAIHLAIELLRGASLEHAYIVAWDEWEANEDARLWDNTVADGIPDAAR